MGLKTRLALGAVLMASSALVANPSYGQECSIENLDGCFEKHLAPEPRRAWPDTDLKREIAAVCKRPTYLAHVMAIIDGDTIDVMPVDETGKNLSQWSGQFYCRIRLWGIDAPEKFKNKAWTIRNEPGWKATEALEGILSRGDRIVRIELRDIDRWDRVVATVTYAGMAYKGDFIGDFSCWMALEGHAAFKGYYSKLLKRRFTDDYHRERCLHPVKPMFAEQLRRRPF